MSKQCAFLVPLLTFLAACAMSLPARAEMEMTPPDRARIVGSIPQVTFRWGGRPDRLYQVEVVSVRGAVVATQTTRHCWALFTLPAADVEYRWRLRELVGREFREVGTRSFHLTTDLTYRFDGREGSEGADGGEGESVTVTLEKMADYIRVQVQGGGGKADFLLIPVSAPVAISAQGGKGGTGATGQSGNVGFMGGPPTNGGPGGPGGNGGKGGTVRIVTNGVDAKKHVKVQVAGGEAGKGGPGGRPGTLPYMAQPGADGADGKRGDPGTVLID